MKIVSILLMIVGIIMIIGYGFLYLFGFAMSFDAPGSAKINFEDLPLFVDDKGRKFTDVYLVR